MKRHYSYIFLSLIVLTLFIACTIEPDKGSSLVTITIGKKGDAASVHIEKYTFFVKAERFLKGLMPYEAFAAVPSIVKVISFEIRGSDMDTITRDVIVSGQSQITEAFEVTNGDSRVFSVKGKDSSGTALYSGSTTENLDGTDVSITITLKRVNTSNVTVTVSGLTGTGLVLQNNGVDDLSISTDGSFTFSTSIADDSNYSVTVLTQPTSPSQTCTVSNGSGIFSSSNLPDVTVNCSALTYSVGGTVSGLTGTGLVLQNNGGDDLSISADGSLTFSTSFADDSSYSVTVLTQPTSPNQTCTVSSGSGTILGAGVTAVSVSCSTTTYTVGVTVSGLSGTLVLQNNGEDDLSISADGSFTFLTPIADTSSYGVTVSTQPTSPSQTCTVSSGSGTISGAAATNVSVSCSTTYTVGGTVSALSGTGLVLRNNGVDDLSITANGSFTFSTAIADASSYGVTVLTQPTSPNQTCAVSSGSGTISGTAITSVSVSCSTNTYTVGGTAKGLAGTLILQNNTGDDLTLSAIGSFTFPTAIADGSSYSVTVSTQPSLQTCTVISGSGTLSGANIASVDVLCLDNVIPLYSSAPNWNDYVQRASPTTACTGAETGGYQSCIHGGESLTVGLPAETDCNGVSATDALGAFEWWCDPSGSPVKMVSKGLADGKYLSDLIDWTVSPPVWKINSVTVITGSGTASTAPAVWWTNPITEANSGGILATAGTIYVATVNPSPNADFEFGSDKVGLVIKPGITIQGDDANLNHDIEAILHNFIWLEGSVDSSGTLHGVEWLGVKFSVMRNLHIGGDSTTGDSVYLGDYLGSASRSNMLSDIAAINNYKGFYIVGSSNNTFRNMLAANNQYTGFYITDSSNNIFANIMAVNNGSRGIYINASNNNIFSNVTSANNTYRGIDIDLSVNNVLSNVTAVNNGSYGVDFSNYSKNNFLSNVTTVNNGYEGIELCSDSSYNTLSNISSANNQSYGVSLYSTAYNNRFTGDFKVGSNIPGDCYVELESTAGALWDDSGGADGTHDGLCLQSYPPSDFGTATTSVDMTSSYVGKVITEDTKNTSDAGGWVASFPGDPTTFDWTDFDNHYRGWGLDGSDFPNLDHSGQWTTPYQGRIWDWSLALIDTGDSGGPVAKDALSLPTGNDTITHSWYDYPLTPYSQADCDTNVPGSTFVTDHCESTFLRNAVEMMDDSINNGNGLCESNENCLYTPNIGSYQGHGKPISAGSFADGTLFGIFLLKFEYNGR